VDFTAPKTAPTNGITMEYFEQGEGTPVLLLHGFPEHPYSWRNQVDPIAAAGFRVIVPSQRGFAGTDAPADAQTYSCGNLVADVAGLLDALGIEQAVWFGHDWGSMPAWSGGPPAPGREARHPRRRPLAAAGETGRGQRAAGALADAELRRLAGGRSRVLLSEMKIVTFVPATS
jgi:pimeloyl-ACP methyl ester carboxylesterase